LSFSQSQQRYAAPSGATEIVLVRHGSTEGFDPARPFPLVGGHGDPALSPEGETQALLVAERLATERVDALYVTSLRRTIQTAAPFLARRPMPARVEPELREVYLGEWEGGWFRKFAAEGDARYLRSLEEGEWGHIPGAETTAAFTRRCVDAVARIHRAHVDERVVCVVHGGVIGAICAHATRAHATAFAGADNGSMHTVIALGADLWLRRFNDTTHLDT
jgi:2,3-bisphosphoglycerate-dependent phosphoglycerate mutase